MVKTYDLGRLAKKDLAKLMQRANVDISSVRKKAGEICREVKMSGDKALVKFSRKFDDANFRESALRITKTDIREAYKNTDGKVIRMIKEQILLSRKFHRAQLRRITRQWAERTGGGIVAGEKWVPIDEVGLYIPGGKNPFPTVQQILAVAAKTAGCRRVVSCISPRGKNYETIVAAAECSVDEIYRAGGAQAIAAMAYGTKTIRPVQLIAGPGSPYVTAAKIICQEKVAIDMPAGPSEALILADGSTTREVGMRKKAAYCAADMLARAEHGPDSAVVLVTDSVKLAELTKKEITLQLKGISRKGYAKKALGRYSAIIIAKNMQEATRFANDYAPEHLEVLTRNPKGTLRKIRNAGSVFLGYNNPVAVGDYASGINHILPTGGWAKKASPVGVWTFMKRVQYSFVDKKGLTGLMPVIDAISKVEGLDAHGKSAEIRLNGKDADGDGKNVRRKLQRKGFQWKGFQ